MMHSCLIEMIIAVNFVYGLVSNINTRKIPRRSYCLIVVANEALRVRFLQVSYAIVFA